MNKRQIVVIGLLGCLAGAFFASRLLMEFDWNPTAPIKFGEVFVEENEYARELLGDVVIHPQAGHDGHFFFSQAMDPFYLNPEVHAIHLDRQTYRAQRMAYPTLASLGGILSPIATAWGLIVVNIIAMGIGAAYTALVAVRMGLSRWFAFAFILNPGLIVAINIDGGGIVAMAAMMAGVYYTMEDRLWPAAIALTVASLARETMLIAAIGLGLYVLWSKRKIPWTFVTPAVAVFGWWIYVHWRLDDGLAQDTQAVGLPFVGFAEALGRWLSEPNSSIDLLMGFMLLIVSIALLVRSVRRPTALGWAVSGFAFLGILLSEPVWHKWFDSSRALAPVLTAYVLLVPAAAKADRERNEQEVTDVDTPGVSASS